MRRIPIIVLSMLLAAAIISGFILYGEYRKTKDALLLSEKKRSSLDEKIIQLNQEKTALEDQVRESAKHFERLKNAKGRISELEKVINIRDRSISDSEDKLLKFRSDSEEKEKIIAALRSELASKGTLISDLKEKLEITESQLASLKNEIARGETEIEMLRRGLADTQGESAQLKISLDQIKSAHSDIVSELQSQMQNKEVTIVELEKKLSITFLDRVLFKSGRATITSEGRDILRRVGDILTKVRDKQIRVVGHTDNKAILPKYRNKFPSNWELSAARAGAVVRYFQKEIGLDPKNMEAVGRSFYEPVASNETEEGRAQNRRVNIIIAPKTELEK